MSCRRPSRCWSAAWSVLLGFISAHGALAQTASQITPPSFRPDNVQSGSAIVFSGRPGLGTPAGADKLSVRLRSVTIEGGRAELSEAQGAIRTTLEGRKVLAADIFAAARDLEAAFARAGYVLTRVVLPAQTLNDGGHLRLVVVDGFIERIDVKDAPDNARARIEALLQPLVGQRGLTIGAIERQLLLAGDVPGVALRSALSAGSAQGGAVLTAQAIYRPVSGFISVDNTFSPSLGRWSTGIGLDANTLLGFGETVYVRAVGHPSGDNASGFGDVFGETPRVRTLAAGLVLPIGLDGMTLNIEGADSRTTPLLPGFVQSASQFDRVSVRLRYPWIRSRGFNLSSDIAFDAQSEKLRLLVPGASLPLSLDRLRILRLATDGDYRLDSGAIIAGRATLSFGLDAFGARSAADATPLLPLSRQGADADFQKLDATISVVQPVAPHLTVGLYARGQTSFGQVMPRSEQIGIASFQELSTFDTGTLGGDSGWVVRGEVSSPWVIPVGATPLSVAPYAFGATGGLYLEQPTILERSHLQVSSVGFGMRLTAPLWDTFTLASLTLEYGRRFRDDGFADGNRFTLVGSIRF